MYQHEVGHGGKTISQSECSRDRIAHKANDACTHCVRCSELMAQVIMASRFTGGEFHWWKSWLFHQVYGPSAYGLLVRDLQGVKFIGGRAGYSLNRSCHPNL